MKKIFALFSFVLLAFTFTGCQEPMEGDFLHTDNTISAIYMTPGTGTSSLSVSGVIDNEAGTITFTVPKDKRREIDLTQVKLRASVALDAFITPSLMGWHDISSPMEISVTASMTGEVKKYTLSASYEK